MSIKVPPSDNARAAAGLETFLLRRLLESARVLTGPKGSMQEAMFTDTLADALAKSGGLGVAKMLDASLSQRSAQLAGGGESSTASASSPRGSGLAMAAQPGLMASGHPLLPEGTPDLLEGVPDRISSPYGVRRDPFTGALATHDGVDLPAPEGTAILAPADGVVSFVGERGGYGKVVEIRLNDGNTLRFAHTRASLVELGQRVESGQAVAEVGSSGRSTGPHLHLELLQQNRSLDPIRALKSYSARDDNMSAGKVQ